MVKESTHLFAANRIFRQIKDREIKKIIGANMDHYYLGSVIPDAFYYVRTGKKNDVSAILHGKTGNLTNEIIFKILDIAREKPNEKDLAFIMGYCTHCALDITFHPVLYYFTGNYRDGSVPRKRSTYLHYHYETYLDKKWNDSFRFESIIHPKFLDDITFPDLISAKMNVPKKKIRKAIKRQRLFNRLDRSRLIYYILYFLAKLRLINKVLLALFYENLKKDKTVLADDLEYRDVITGESKKSSQKDLFEASFKLGGEMIKAAFDYSRDRMTRDECARVISGKSLSTGRLNVGAAEVKYTLFSE